MTNKNNTLELKILPKVVLCAPRPNDKDQPTQNQVIGVGYPFQKNCHALEKELILLHLGVGDHEMRNQYPLQYNEWGCHHQKKYPVWSLVEYGKMVVLMMATFRRNLPLPFFLHQAIS